ncbi:MAG: 3-phosphoshikimate 1-carboxyvinyltransferase [Chloroflexi bacterium]|nr:3-phosphoshikimate 1-carboxyvinyltransferase [Chloroflexota bacterium]
MQRSVRPPRALKGTIVPPGDKSISHRAAILNAVAQGEAVVENFQRGGDCLATLRCLRLLGVDWRWDGDSLWVRGRGRRGLTEPSAVLDCANSGTTLRLLTGLLAAQPFFTVLSGDASLRTRPMDRIVEPLCRMGADIRGRDGDRKPPLALSGRPLKAIRYRLPVASAQVKSALLLAGLYADGETVVGEPAPTRDHTERTLQAMGAEIRRGEGVVSIKGQGRELSPLSMRVPGDISAAAHWMVAAAAHPDAEVRLNGVGVNPSRAGVLDAFRLMGAEVRLEEERTWGCEPVADVVVRSSRLRGAIIEGELIPRLIDEIPLLALAACFAEGETVIRDAADLRVKESDRIHITARELRRLGADVEEQADGLLVRPVKGLKGAAVASHGDHRLAMMLAVAGLLAQGETKIRNADVVEVSYSRFWSDLSSLAG